MTTSARPEATRFSSAAPRRRRPTCAPRSKRDTKLLVPLVLLVVFAILVVLLRAVVAPVMLMATVSSRSSPRSGSRCSSSSSSPSFPGEDPSYPLFAFIFLVALGVDYNIFLMARVREEAHRMPTRDAMLTSLSR